MINTPSIQRIILTVSLLSLTLAGQSAVGWNTFSHPSCGYTFDYPESWQIVSQEKRCAVKLRPLDYEERMREYDVDLHTLVVDTLDADFLRAANEAGFDFDRGQWITRSRMGQAYGATVIHTDKWSGVRGIAIMGCYHTGTEGGYAGLCDFEKLAVKKPYFLGKVLVMSGGPQTGDAFEMIFNSFELDE